MSFVGCRSQRYPELLKSAGGLSGLYYRGRWSSSIFDRCVAIVGSRKMTDYGRIIIGRLVPSLVEEGVTIVSGFMYGVDQQAHAECVRCGGRTIAVLGWGIDRRLGNREEELLQRITAERGLIVSEYPGNTPATRWTFPQRNRIVALLSQTTVVIEAAEKSGSLITAGWAERLGRKVYAVPGPVTSRTSAGTNQLIKDGKAVMVTDPCDIIRDFGATAHTINSMGANGEKRGALETGEVERRIVTALDNGPMYLDLVIRTVGGDAGQVNSAVSVLEVRGVIRRVGNLLELCP